MEKWEANDRLLEEWKALLAHPPAVDMSNTQASFTVGPPMRNTKQVSIWAANPLQFLRTHKKTQKT